MSTTQIWVVPAISTKRPSFDGLPSPEPMPSSAVVGNAASCAIHMIGTQKGAGVARARYAGLGVSGSVRTVVGSVLSPREKPSGVEGAGAVTTGAETVRGGRGWLLTSVAINAGRTIRPDRSRRFIAALDRGLSSPFAPWARGDQHRSAGAAFARVAHPVSATTGAATTRLGSARASRYARRRTRCVRSGSGVWGRSRKRYTPSRYPWGSSE